MPTLRFTPYAWAKLLYLRDLGHTEVGGFGISSSDELLLIEDIQLVRQQCTIVTVKFQDEAVADFFDQQVDAGRRPEQFARVWIHTHPGNSALPSGTDEETFARCFGNSDWAVMFIIAESGETYARLKFNIGPSAAMLVPVEVEYGCQFSSPDRTYWSAEYKLNVETDNQFTDNAWNQQPAKTSKESCDQDLEYFDAWQDYSVNDNF